mmetsp:Transcript_19031/g.76455  ORF Transcript_19031/g.76455 Transcript_19031/m.76455 type:complete len:97 (+) Transcript_19031:38-328(+)
MTWEAGRVEKYGASESSVKKSSSQSKCLQLLAAADGVKICMVLQRRSVFCSSHSLALINQLISLFSLYYVNVFLKEANWSKAFWWILNPKRRNLKC